MTICDQMVDFQQLFHLPAIAKRGEHILKYSSI